MAEGRPPSGKGGEGGKKSGGGVWGFLDKVLKNVSFEVNVGTPGPAPRAPSGNPTDPVARMEPVRQDRKETYDELVYRSTKGTEGQAPAVRMDRERQYVARSLDARTRQGTGDVSIPKGGGEPLAKDVRARMEPTLGADLSNVKVHRASESAAAAEGLNAKAFAVGQDVHFGSGQYQPGTKEGDHLLAHELTHVVQGQRSGVQRKADEGAGNEHAGHDPAAGPGAKVSKPGEPAEQEADAVADKVSDKLHGQEAAGKDSAPGEKQAAVHQPAPTIGAKLHAGEISLAPKPGATPAPTTGTPKAAPNPKRYVIKVERRAGEHQQVKILQGAREEVLLQLRSFQLKKDEFTTKDLVGNLAMASLRVDGTTKGGIAAGFDVNVGRAGLSTIFSSGSGVSVQGVDVPVVDSSGKVLKAGTTDALAKKIAGDIMLGSGGGAAPVAGPDGAKVQVADEAELRKLIEENAGLVGNRAYVPFLDKHSEAVVWQALKFEDAAIAKQIGDLGLKTITSVRMQIFSEREMCGNCALKSAEIMGRLSTFAPQTWEVLQRGGGKDAKLGTDVDSTHKFGGAAKGADAGAAHPTAAVATPPTGKTGPNKGRKG